MNNRRWSDEDNAAFIRLYNAGASLSELRQRFPGRSDNAFCGRMVVLQTHRPPRPARVKGVRQTNSAIVSGRTLFPGRVISSKNAKEGVLVSGKNQRKLGSVVEKGPWKGMPIFSLTLEERATCPASCHHWTTCMGNGMHVALRYAHGSELEDTLAQELYKLNCKHPDGFVVRLHVLGDFYSVEYVQKWAEWLHQYPALRVFGYTAWPTTSAIGREVRRLTNARWHRFAIRLSTTELQGRQRAITGWEWPYTPRRNEIVCPVQSGRTRDCGTCGLCWSPSARNKAIVFIAHGR